MTTHSDENVRPKAPFIALPDGIAIAHYFIEETDHRNPGCDGIDLWREGGDYCYLWVEAMVDLDMWNAYLLDIRTRANVPEGEKFGETRDFLFVFHGCGDRFDVEWFNQPYAPFAADADADHWERWHNAMVWFANRVEQAVEDAEKANASRFRPAAPSDPKPEHHWSCVFPCDCGRPCCERLAHEFNEDVNDASMCMCGIPALVHDEVMASRFRPGKNEGDKQ